jgi:hypothetical protein
MIKLGDKAKGFRFDNTSGVRWNKQMENFVGLEGIVRQVRPKMNELVIGFMGTTIHIDTLRVMPAEPNMQHWCYPLDQYLVLQREQRLNEIGI